MRARHLPRAHYTRAFANAALATFPALRAASPNPRRDSSQCASRIALASWIDAPTSGKRMGKDETAPHTRRATEPGGNTNARARPPSESAQPARAPARARGRPPHDPRRQQRGNHLAGSRGMHHRTLCWTHPPGRLACQHPLTPSRTPRCRPHQRSIAATIGDGRNGGEADPPRRRTNATPKGFGRGLRTYPLQRPRRRRWRQRHANTGGTRAEREGLERCGGLHAHRSRARCSRNTCNSESAASSARGH